MLLVYSSQGTVPVPAPAPARGVSKVKGQGYVESRFRSDMLLSLHRDLHKCQDVHHHHTSRSNSIMDHGDPAFLSPSHTWHGVWCTAPGVGGRYTSLSWSEEIRTRIGERTTYVTSSPHTKPPCSPVRLNGTVCPALADIKVVNIILLNVAQRAEYPDELHTEECDVE